MFLKNICCSFLHLSRKKCKHSRIEQQHTVDQEIETAFMAYLDEENLFAEKLKKLSFVLIELEQE